MPKGRKKIETTVVVPLADDGWTPAHLEESLLSALKQTGRFRLSVVDGTKSIEIRRLVMDLIPSEMLEYDEAVASGPASVLHCLYQAVASAKSRWITYLEPGVVWRPDHLFRLVTMAKRGDLDVAFSGGHVKFESWDDIPTRLRRVNEIALCGVIHSLAAYQRLYYGWRREQIWSDWDLWLQFVVDGARFGHDPQTTAVRRVPRAGILRALARGRVVDTSGFFTPEEQERLRRWDDYVGQMER